MTACAVVSVTVKVATPLALVVAGEVVMTEEPEPAVKVTLWPETGFEFASFKVTVIVEVVTPSAATLVGDATIVDLPGLVVDVTGPAVKVTPTVPTTKLACEVSVAV